VPPASWPPSRALTEDALLAGEAHQVPHDQEVVDSLLRSITASSCLLAQYPGGGFQVSLAQPLAAQRFQVLEGAHPRRRGEDGQRLQAEAQVEVAVFGDPGSVPQSIRVFGEPARHLLP
jgi:hypothetical protein